MIIPEDEKKIQNALSSVVEIPKTEWVRLRNILTYRELQPGQYFVRAGDVPLEIGFVLTGLLRKFYETQDGNLYIKDFSVENRLVTSYSALILGQASRLNIQAMEPTRLLAIPFSNLKELYTLHKCWEAMGRRIAENLFIEREQREWELLVFKAEERYALFKRQFPDLISRIPQYDIASYLGISPVSLSRIIGQKKKQFQ